MRLAIVSSRHRSSRRQTPIRAPRRPSSSGTVGSRVAMSVAAGGRRIERIDTDHAAQQRRHIADGPCDRADRVPGERDRDRSRATDEPGVGLSPTTPQSEDGITIEPYVSRPTAPAAKLAATAAAEPELESPVLKFSAYGLRPIPARPLHPPRLGQPRKAFHSDMLALPSRIAPASRRRVATPASRGTIDPTRASEPAVVSIRSAVAITSFRTIGMPCSGPRTCPAARSRSSSAAIASASGLTSMIEFTRGPAQSSASMRAM